MKSGFSTRLQVEFTPGQFKCRVLKPLIYRTDRGLQHVVPPGFESDFGSVPGYVVLPCLVPRIGILREGFVLHDWLYNKGHLPRRRADRLFLQAGLTLLRDLPPVGRAIWTARLVLGYAGVAMFGWIPWSAHGMRG
jgi:hypothetical protein